MQTRKKVSSDQCYGLEIVRKTVKWGLRDSQRENDKLEAHHCQYLKLGILPSSHKTMPIPRLHRASALFKPSRRAFATHANIPSQHSQLRTKDCTTLIPPYEHLLSQLERVREILKRPLTLSEKILYSHLTNVEDLTSVEAGKLRGQAYLKLRPDRVALQDASAQMAILQFATCGAHRTAVPTSIHCDHLISAYAGAEADLKRAQASEKEVFNFLESA